MVDIPVTKRLCVLSCAWQLWICIICTVGCAVSKIWLKLHVVHAWYLNEIKLMLPVIFKVFHPTVFELYIGTCQSNLKFRDHTWQFRPVVYISSWVFYQVSLFESPILLWFGQVLTKFIAYASWLRGGLKTNYILFKIFGRFFEALTPLMNFRIV